jgi:hypothetical protein
MAVSRSLHRWLRLPSRIALILGLGALSTAGASADAQANQTASGGALIRSDGGKIYLSKGAARPSYGSARPRSATGCCGCLNSADRPASNSRPPPDHVQWRRQRILLVGPKKIDARQSGPGGVSTSASGDRPIQLAQAIDAA